jgi:oxygen-dependent protoporphyrinogen oxidase
MKKIVVIGSGFSGISAAYFLNLEGFDVEVIEKGSSPGGLIKTIQTNHGLCETAANGILNSKIFEDLAENVSIQLLSTQKFSKRRYIFRNRLRRWPLNIFETLLLIFKFIFSKKIPKDQESILKWGQRVLGLPATRYLLAPVLQGIYAGDPSKLSASLILNRFFSKSRKPKPKIHGLVSPAGGMEEFFFKTENYLKQKGVKFSYNKIGALDENQTDKVHVIATSSFHAGELLKSKNAGLADELQSIETLSLVKITGFFNDTLEKIKGFGVLFPKDQKVNALGILFNNFIFTREAPKFLSESFIYGGAFDPLVVNLDETQILQKVKEDRQKLYGGEEEIEGFHLQRWPSTLPHYNLQLESKLKKMAPDIAELEKQGIYIIGNYLGGIGLSQLLERAAQLPKRIRKLHGYPNGL